MALRQLRTQTEWAEDRLQRAGERVSEIVRVFPSQGFMGDTALEILYLDEGGRPRTAWIEPDGRLVSTKAGW